MALTCASSLTSTETALAVAPADVSSATAAADFVASRPATTIAAPYAASPRAMPRPMPPLPPVTIATLPRRSNMFFIASLLVVRASPVAADAYWRSAHPIRRCMKDSQAASCDAARNSLG